MSVIGSEILAGASGNQGYFIQKSLRFRSSASAYLNRTPASAGNRQTWTWSGWVKRGNLDSSIARDIFAAGTSGSSALDSIEFNSERLRVYSYGGSYVFQYITNAVYRDPSAWYHIMVAVDTTQATASNRVKIYVNGVQVTSFSTATDPSQNANCAYFNTANPHYFCKYIDQSFYTDCYLAEVNFIDGQALTPSSFGEYSPSTGVWQAKKYAGTYGTNGFYLPFSDNSSTTTLGYDKSGNSNNWTTNNISLTAGSTYDSMIDVPTVGELASNYAVLNPLDNGGSSSGAVVLSNANLNFSASGGTAPLVRSTIGNLSGKWYWEVTSLSGLNHIGVALDTAAIGTELGGATGGWAYLEDGRKYNAGSATAYGSSYTVNDVIGVALDMDAGTLTFYKNGVSQGQAFSGISGNAFPSLSKRGGSTSTMAANFGQRPFAYTPPTGFKALNTYNLPTPTIGATASSQANKYMDVSLWTGNSSTQNITNSGSMQPDLVWIKARSVPYDNRLFDSSRTLNSWLSSNLTSAEINSTLNDNFLSYNSDGFSLGATSGTNGLNQSGQTFVGWQWRASNATPVTNTAGSITSTVSANTTSGFSVVTYTGTGSNATVGHGLGVAPKMIFIKRRNSTSDWSVYYNIDGLGAGVRYLLLNSTAAGTYDTTYWNSTVATSSVFSLGTNGNPNTNTGTYVAYCFSEVAGYSKFGSYTGNGSSDGTFVHLGFRPKYVLTKRTDSTSFWLVTDSSRDTYNVNGNRLYPNGSNAENYSAWMDFTSNGFKLRSADENASGGSYIYMAFAENPFKYSLAR